jgi:hypothetical protein
MHPETGARVGALSPLTSPTQLPRPPSPVTSCHPATPSVTSLLVDATVVPAYIHWLVCLWWVFEGW